MVAGELAATLERELAGEVRADAYTRHLFAADASMFAVEPLAVAFPRDADDVAAAVSVARAARRADRRRAAAARASPGRPPAGAGWCSTLSRHMNAIDAIDADALRVRVQPGVVQEDLNRAAKRYGLGFGPDTSTSNRATLGGMIGNNSSGSESIVYGTTIDHVLELEVVLADGSRATFSASSAPRARSSDASTSASRRCCATTRGRSPRTTRSTGASPAATGSTGWTRSTSPSSIVGSEGTLAIVTAATVEARRAAEGEDVRRRALRLAAGRDRRHRGRARAAAVRGRDDRPHDPRALALASSSTARSPTGWKATRRRCCSSSFAADTEDEVRDKLDELDARLGAHGHGYHTLRAETAADQAALTKVRKAGLGLLMAASEGRTRPAAFVEDTAVAPERLGEYVARFQEIFDRARARGRLLRALLGRLPAHPPVPRPLRPDQVETMRDGRERGRRPRRASSTA